MPCRIPRKQKMLKTIRVSAMPVAVRLTPSRGGGEPAQTGEWTSEVLYAGYEYGAVMMLHL